MTLAVINTPTRGRAALAVFALVLSFLFIRVYNSSPVFLVPSMGDDGGYFAYTEAMFRTRTLDWCAPGFTYANFQELCERARVEGRPERFYNKYGPGPAMLLLPFNLAGAFLSAATIYTPSGIDRLAFWSLVGTFFLFFLGLLLAYQIALRFVPTAGTAFLATVLFAFGSPVLYFVFRRPFMSHSQEFFLFFLGAWLILRFHDLRGRSRIIPVAVGLTSGLLLASRTNDGLLVGVAALWLGSTNLRTLSKRWLLFGVGLLPPLAVLVATYWLQRGTLTYSTSSYDGLTGLQDMLGFQPSDLRRVADFFVARHWGYFWLVPFAFCQFYVVVRGVRTFRRLKLLWATAAVAFLHLVIMGNYGSNGMSYGYRYTLPVFYGFHILFLACLGKTRLRLLQTRAGLAIASVLALLGGLNIVNFESNDSTLTLTMGRSIDEGIYDPKWQDYVCLIGPNYAFNSLGHTLKGKAFANFGASPVAAYPLMALRGTFVAHLPGVSTALAYYESPKRNIHSLGDLRVLFQYQFWCALLLAAGFGGAWLLRSHRRRGSRRGSS